MKKGIYIHLPYCRNICNYCDFAVVKLSGSIDKYIDAVCSEIDIYFQHFPKENTPISTLNFGGGTPTLMSAQQLEKILNKLSQHFDLSNISEISVESNPGTFPVDKMIDYLSLGINRVSIGVQTFVKSELGAIKRDHSPSKAERTIRNAIEQGFNSVNLDLIFSLPQQTLKTWEYTLDKAIELGTNHISAYSLTYEEGTPLFKSLSEGKIAKQSQDFDADIYEFTISKLADNGLEQYEVSNFAQDGKQCQHNLDNWHANEYYAFGLGSHGFVGGLRYWNFRDMSKYFKHIQNNELPREGQRKNSEEERVKEHIFLPIRADGINFKEFTSNTNLDINKLIPRSINKFSQSGHININERSISLTPLGYAICDTISLKIIEEFEENYK